MAGIICKHINKKYGELEVVEDFSLEVADQEFIVFLGPSGCGKSTILRMLAGLEDITGGDLLIGGQRMNDAEPGDRGIAMVFQNYALYPHMTIRENIAFGLRRQKTPESEIDQRVGAVTKTLGLKPYLGRKPTALSGGQQQRVAIARAMIKTPDVFLFDEPLSNLDAKLRAHMRVEIARLHKELRTTSVYVTHDQMEAMTLADRIVLLNAGRIEQIGTPEEIYSAPRTLFVAGFIGTPAMNFLTLRPRRTETGWQLCGDSFQLAISGSAFDLHEGQQVIMGLRPSRLRPVDAGFSGPSVQGEVSLTEFHGDSVLASFSLDGVDLGSLMPAEERPREGANLTFGFAEEDIHLFDAGSGISLRC
ncbi:ABC transporter ATP-binding protein [Roseinatronobacter alkalisoli]|uniref:Sn-glycerol-3-phosphate ABC transporter ATP-binding protein UgpC n=1 Tax=Roseinatronobacter alkalisoli TaxID=3028235 RepID=A0ABT5T7I6_9RHOB|nr:sn-glycerol-3-phosphate ABC transporter ATP-binding protein UgpC [Roseinatronobacter sp. HJB301]MDD7971083.1 sn-glycerol-3-phosphate ABC transporter ATP-binding protein UgpC [Roseinatronobacter sp. HJB301]